MLRRVRTYCEKAKRILSVSTQTTIDIESLSDGQDLNIVITRNKFEDLCINLFKRCMVPIENIFRETKINKNQIKDILLTGGSTRIPKIQQMIQEFFDGKELNKTINPEESVACGTAIYGASITTVKDEFIERLVLLDVNQYSLGIETIGDCFYSKKFNYSNKKNSDFFYI